MSTKDRNKVVERLMARIKPDNKQFVRKNVDIMKRVRALMALEGISQKELASRLGKKESEVSRCLTGLHNLTLRSITSMEVALGTDIIVVPPAHAQGVWFTTVTRNRFFTVEVKKTVSVCVAEETTEFRGAA